MATTYQLIASVTVGSGGTSSLAFSSIPQTYTDLLIKLSTRSNRTASYVDALAIKFNGSGGTAYSDVYLAGDGSSTLTNLESSLAFNSIMYGNTNLATANTFSNNEIYIPNYASSKNKTSMSDGATESNIASQPRMSTLGAYWSNTAAITDIAITSQNAATFQQYTTAYLYGIKNS